MKLHIRPGKPLIGTACVPGDKSLSHRAVLFAALADGESRVENFLVSGVTRVMLESLTRSGAAWRLDGEVLTVRGQGLNGLHAPYEPLHCGNSATTLRLLAGAVAAAGISAVLDGSAGLRRRPMDRIVDPLRRMGVPVRAEAGTAPIVFQARPTEQRLLPLDEDLPVASAQVKSCLLLAALAASGVTILREPGPSRDHTERMLGSMGVKIDRRVLERDGIFLYETRLEPPDRPLKPLHLRLPGDFSAAAFLITAGLIVPGSDIRIPGVGLNPTRTGLLEVLVDMGADITLENHQDQAGEPVGDLRVRASPLRGTEVSGERVVRMIDEFSVFGAAAALAEGVSVVRDAQELRYKETDRIQTLVQELRGLGVTAGETPDGFSIQGGGLPGGTAQAHGDHRLAMAVAVAGLGGQGPVTIEGAEMIDESFPGFVETLHGLGADVILEEEGR